MWMAPPAVPSGAVAVVPGVDVRTIRSIGRNASIKAAIVRQDEVGEGRATVLAALRSGHRAYRGASTRLMPARLRTTRSHGP